MTCTVGFALTYIGLLAALVLPLARSLHRPGRHW
jgi:hypothetical protein